MSIYRTFKNTVNFVTFPAVKHSNPRWAKHAVFNWDAVNKFEVLAGELWLLSAGIKEQCNWIVSGSTHKSIKMCHYLFYTKATRHSRIWIWECQAVVLLSDGLSINFLQPLQPVWDNCLVRLIIKKKKFWHWETRVQRLPVFSAKLSLVCCNVMLFWFVDIKILRVAPTEEQ